MQILVNEVQREVRKIKNADKQVSSPQRHLDVLDTIDVVDAPSAKSNLLLPSAKPKSSLLRKISPKFGRKAYLPQNSIKLSTLTSLRQNFKTLHLKYKNEILNASKTDTKLV